MKTVVFFLSPFCGGAERMSITIAKLLDKKEYDVRFVVIGQEVGEIGRFIPNEYPVSLVRIRNIYDFTTFRVYWLLKRLKPDYVFCSLVYLAPRVILASRMSGCGKVIIRWNCAVNRVTGITKWLITKTLHKADTVIAQTETMQKEIEDNCPLSKGRVMTLHNLIDKSTIEEKLKNAENPYYNNPNKVLVWIGRFDPVKCIDVLVRAFEKAYNVNKSISLYLVGKYNVQESYYQSIRDLVMASGCQENIHFVGFQDNPYKWIKYADCLALSSRSEASPNALFESLYLGIPAVSTRCTPNIDDIIQDGVNGYKVEVGDVSAMADALSKAVRLKNVPSVYKHSSEEDFITLFT